MERQTGNPEQDPESKGAAQPDYPARTGLTGAHNTTIADRNRRLAALLRKEALRAARARQRR